MGQFLADIIHWVIWAFITCMIVNAIMSWLIVFEVINLRNQLVRQILNFLDAVTRPVLRPVRRIIPPIGNIDITPVIVIVVLSLFEQDILARYLYPLLINMLG